jgi:beta-phosphoglucomutase
MAEQKNDVYRSSLSRLKRSDILPGVLDILNSLKQRGIRTAIGSSSRNATTILSAVGLNDQFDAVVDGTHISLSKPDPEVFLLAAQKLDADPANCLVVEDADAGVEAAKRAGMRVLGVGPACHHPASTLGAADLTTITIDEMLSIHSGNTE